MANTDYAVILAASISHAIKAERLLAAAGIACKLIPVPRQLSSQCGVCARIRRQDREQALEALAAGNIELEGAYDV